MRSRAPAFTLKTGLMLLGLGLLSIWTWMGLASCHSDRVAVNPKDPQAPQFAYRQDQLALLSMLADDIQDLERKKQYTTIYDDYTSQEFKAGISRRRFLIISNCVETYLGGLEEYDPHDLGFRREMLKTGHDQFLDVLNRKVKRIMGSIDEQMVFVPSDLNFKLNGLYWIAKDKQFLQCVAESPQREAEGQPVPETTAEEGVTPSATQATSPTEAETPAATIPETDAAGESPSDQPGTGAAQPGSGESSSPVESPATAPSAGTSENTLRRSTGSAVPIPSPVQEMKPAEARKVTTLQARPAGAGAVIDERPVLKPKATTPVNGDSGSTRAPIPGDSSTSERRHDAYRDNPGNSGKAVPLPITPLKPEQPATPPVPH